MVVGWCGEGPPAARTVLRNPSTRSSSRPAWAASISEAPRRSEALRPVSPVADWTSVMARVTSVVPAEACCTLRAISAVAASCSCTAEAMAVAMSFTCWMVMPMERMASTAAPVAPCMDATCWPISSVARAVWVARLFTSFATTAKPFPASPARAASIVAFSASRLVCEAMSAISFTTSPMRAAAVESCAIVWSVELACAAASDATLALCSTWRAISWIEAESSSAAVATVCTFDEACSAAAATAPACSSVRPALPVSVEADDFICPAPEETAITTSFTPASNSSAMARRSALRRDSASASSRARSARMCSVSSAFSRSTATAFAMRPISSARSVSGTATDRSPSAIRPRVATCRPMGPVIVPAASRPITPPAPRMTSATTVSIVIAPCRSCAVASAGTKNIATAITAPSRPRSATSRRS